MTILITGAGGLVGRHLVAALEPEVAVVAVSRQAAPGGGAARWIESDLSLPTFVDAMPTGIDTVVHLAQSPHYHQFPDAVRDVFDVNVASTARLLDWARRSGVRRFVYASAGGADRSTLASRPSFYLAGKLAAELMARSYSGLLTVTVLRPFFVYGRGQRRSMLLPRLVDTVRQGESIRLTGADGIRITPTHVEDAVAAFKTAALHDRPGIFDVAGPETLTLRQVGELIGERLAITPRFEIVSGEAEDIVADVSAMAQQLAVPQRHLADGIADAL